MISNEVTADIKKGSWVRQMFDRGLELKTQVGAENIFDFSLGNPSIDPPASFFEGVRKLLSSTKKGYHRYMPNAGFPEVREVIAKELNLNHQIACDKNHIVMTVGASGGLNVIFKSILNPLEQVIVLAPFFMEYEFYIKNYNCQIKKVATDQNFMPDLDKLAEALTWNVAAVLINSPNNPSGAVYDQATMDAIAEVILQAEKKYRRRIYLISDEPYSNILYDSAQQGSVFKAYQNSLLVTSHSKDFGLAGERIGYVALNPAMTNSAELMEALIFCNRILGFVNAPALMQRVLPYLYDKKDYGNDYAELRDLTCAILKESGFKFVKPKGAFYVFPTSPLKDDLKFVNIALKHNVLVTPGSGFGAPGYFRMSYAVDKKTLLRAKKSFIALAEEAFSLAE